MNPADFGDTEASYYSPSPRSWRWAHRVIGAFLVFVIFGLCAGWFE